MKFQIVIFTFVTFAISNLYSENENTTDKYNVYFGLIRLREGIDPQEIMGDKFREKFKISGDKIEYDKNINVAFSKLISLEVYLNDQLSIGFFDETSNITVSVYLKQGSHEYLISYNLAIESGGFKYDEKVKNSPVVLGYDISQSSLLRKGLHDWIIITNIQRRREKKVGLEGQP